MNELIGPDAGAASADPAGSDAAAPGLHRLALGVSYRGSAYHGWQSQANAATVQDAVEMALSSFAAQPVRTVCAGRTDAGVHALNQIVHIDTSLRRDETNWLRGTNRFLPQDIALQWCRAVPPDFHARNRALGRRYRFVIRQSPVRPALEHGLVGWVFRPLDGDAMRAAAQHLIGRHDFSAFRASGCQSPTPVKTLHRIGIDRNGAYWCFDFDANAFLHHMVRNIVGCLVRVGSGRETPQWLGTVLATRERRLAAPTFGPEGLHFLGPYYDARYGLPEQVAASDWLI